MRAFADLEESAEAAVTPMGWALDVFWEEPEIAPRWFTLENVLLTPHLGGAADDVKVHHSAMVLEDLKTLRGGGVPARVANPEVLLAGRKA